MFGISQAKDRLKLLEENFQLLKQDPLNVSLAEQACSDAWHLTDWVFDEEKENNPSLTKEIFRTKLYKECSEFKILHDLVNSIKHKKLSNPKVTITQTKRKAGAFSNAFSKAFGVSRLEIHFEEGTKVDLDDLVEVAIEYWKKRLN